MLHTLALLATLAPHPAPVAVRPDTIRTGWSAGDVAFITGMIPHHAQAILMAGWAEPNGASREVQVLAARIINAQRDEIAVMRAWLEDRGQPLPEGHAHHHLMPGMLTPEQMEQLAAARGPEFDRRFLVLMIRHHRGAVTMVRELLAQDGTAQDQTVFKLASDIEVDQTTEIARMQRLLAARIADTPP
jgi:uncharacterized protein (DUF305 family)